MVDQIERIANSLDRFSKAAEDLVPAVVRIADSLGKIKDVLNKTLGQGELEDIAGAVLARPFQTRDEDGEEGYVHGLAVLDALEETEEE